MTHGLEDLSIGWLCLLARIFGLLILLPISEDGKPFISKLGLSVGFSLVLFESVPMISTFSITKLFCEILLGVFLSLPVLIVVDLVGGLGELFDSGRGQTIASQYNPFAIAPEGVSAFAAKSFVWVVFVCSGLLEQLIVYVYHSLIEVPLGSYDLIDILLVAKPIVKLLVHQSTVIMKSFLPLAMLFLLAEIVFVSVQVVIPNMGLHSESFILKSALGIMFLCLVVINGLTLDVYHWLHQLLLLVQIIIAG